LITILACLFAGFFVFGAFLESSFFRIHPHLTTRPDYLGQSLGGGADVPVLGA
jgi:hypothetical protein